MHWVWNRQPNKSQHKSSLTLENKVFLTLLRDSNLADLSSRVLVFPYQQVISRSLHYEPYPMDRHSWTGYWCILNHEHCAPEYSYHRCQFCTERAYRCWFLWLFFVSSCPVNQVVQFLCTCTSKPHLNQQRTKAQSCFYLEIFHFPMHRYSAQLKLHYAVKLLDRKLLHSLYLALSFRKVDSW